MAACFNRGNSYNSYNSGNSFNSGNIYNNGSTLQQLRQQRNVKYFANNEPSAPLQHVGLCSSHGAGRRRAGIRGYTSEM
jgi:hypothetical protein